MTAYWAGQHQRSLYRSRRMRQRTIQVSRLSQAFQGNLMNAWSGLRRKSSQLPAKLLRQKLGRLLIRCPAGAAVEIS